MTVTMAVNPRNTPAAPCLTDPDRWAAGGDDPEMKTLCRACPRRWLCAKEAVETPGAEGMWSGVNLPAGGRARAFALRQLALTGRPRRLHGARARTRLRLTAGDAS